MGKIDFSCLKNDGTLSNGRTAEEVEIATVCTNPANIVYADGEWKWKNPKFVFRHLD